LQQDTTGWPRRLRCATRINVLHGDDPEAIE